MVSIRDFKKIIIIIIINVYTGSVSGQLLVSTANTICHERKLCHTISKGDFMTKSRMTSSDFLCFWFTLWFIQQAQQSLMSSHDHARGGSLRRQPTYPPTGPSHSYRLHEASLFGSASSLYAYPASAALASVSQAVDQLHNSAGSSLRPAHAHCRSVLGLSEPPAEEQCHGRHVSGFSSVPAAAAVHTVLPAVCGVSPQPEETQPVPIPVRSSVRWYMENARMVSWMFTWKAILALYIYFSVLLSFMYFSGTLLAFYHSNNHVINKTLGCFLKYHLQRSLWMSRKKNITLKHIKLCVWLGKETWLFGIAYYHTTLTISAVYTVCRAKIFDFSKVTWEIQWEWEIRQCDSHRWYNRAQCVELYIPQCNTRLK